MTTYFTKRRIAEIARKIWPAGDRVDGRETVRTVLTVAGLNVQPRRMNPLDRAALRTPKQLVLARFPKAHGYRWGESYYVTETRESGHVIGSGRNARSAWAQAANRPLR